MTERRISEVVLGALLATAVWALASSFHFVGDKKFSESSLKIADLTFKIIAGLFAAGWALYLVKLIHLPLANAGLNKSEMELEEYQQKKSLLAGLTISLQATAHRIPGRDDFVIIVTADLTNRHESAVLRIDWKEEEKEVDPLHVWMTNFDAQGKPTYKDDTAFPVRRTKSPNLKAGPYRIRPGATESLSFAVGVSAPGIYLVTFRIPLEKTHLEELRKKFDKAMPGAWTRSAHVIVENTPEPLPALEI
jgi:hypothetical protein